MFSVLVFSKVEHQYVVYRRPAVIDLVFCLTKEISGVFSGYYELCAVTNRLLIETVNFSRIQTFSPTSRRPQYHGCSITQWRYAILASTMGDRGSSFHDDRPSCYRHLSLPSSAITRYSTSFQSFSSISCSRLIKDTSLCYRIGKAQGCSDRSYDLLWTKK